MKLQNNGQISLELVISIVILLFFMLLALIYINQGEIQTNIVNTGYVHIINCQKIAQKLGSTYNNGINTHAIVENTYNVYIGPDRVFVNKDGNALAGSNCPHLAVIQTTYSTSENIQIDNKAGGLVFD